MHKLNIRVKRWHRKFITFNQIEIENFCLKDLFIESNRTELQTHRVEEQTFATPCSGTSLKNLLGGRRAYAHVVPSRKMDVFFFFFFVVVVRQLLSPLGVARPALNNGLAIIIRSRDRFYQVSQIPDILVT